MKSERMNARRFIAAPRALSGYSRQPTAQALADSNLTHSRSPTRSSTLGSTGELAPKYTMVMVRRPPQYQAMSGPAEQRRVSE